MINGYQIIDDVIPKKYQDEIEKILLKTQSCPWYLVQDISYQTSDAEFKQITKQFTAFSHVFKNHQGPQSKIYDFLTPLVYQACEQVNFAVNDIVMARSFLQLPNTNGVNNPHIDFKDQHLVLLYYVNDSQGPTVLYNETFPQVPVEEVNQRTLTVKTRIEPKKGRCVFFDGLTYHSSSGPTDDVRCVVNFDLV